MNFHLTLLLLLLPTIAVSGEAGYRITTIDGMVFGPGPMPATPITEGVFNHVILDKGLSGKADYFNNGKDEPNIPGEKEIFGSFRGGLLSNGVPFNEHVDGGIVEIGQGALRMLVVVAADGPNNGGEIYSIDERLNWRLRTDLALDPGYPQGLVISYDLNISTGVHWLGPSHQTEAGNPGGMDHADFIPTGAPYVGAVGDRDDDGFLDGRIIGMSRVPEDFLFVPGAPIVMSRDIVTNIPVSARLSGILELASVANLRLILFPDKKLPEADSSISAYYQRMLPEWAEEFAQRARRASERLKRVDAPEAALASALSIALEAALPVAKDLAAYRQQLSDPLERLEKALPDLVGNFRAETDAN